MSELTTETVAAKIESMAKAKEAPGVPPSVARYMRELGARGGTAAAASMTKDELRARAAKGAEGRERKRLERELEWEEHKRKRKKVVSV